MIAFLRAPGRGIAALCAVVGLILGLAAALVYSAAATPSYEAKATVVMMPAPGVPPAESSYYWEILSRGQVTRTAAIVLADRRWLEQAAQSAGVPASELTLTAGAVADTTLIEATMTAKSGAAAEKGLEKVLEVASADAASISGPFVLKEISAPGGTATSTGISKAQLIPAASIAGLVLGLGVGLLIARTRRGPGARHGSGRPGSGGDIDGRSDQRPEASEVQSRTDGSSTPPVDRRGGPGNEYATYRPTPGQAG